jgi:hypothetical protein
MPEILMLNEAVDGFKGLATAQLKARDGVERPILTASLPNGGIPEQVLVSFPERMTLQELRMAAGTMMAYVEAVEAAYVN